MSSLTFIPVVEAFPRESADRLTTPHLHQATELAAQVVDYLLNVGESGSFSSAVELNAELWRSNVMSLAYYGDQMLSVLAGRYSLSGLPIEYFNQYITSTAQWPRHFEMTRPSWTSDPEVIEAHRSYLIHLEPLYSEVWPGLAPLPLPFPRQKGLVAYGF